MDQAYREPSLGVREGQRALAEHCDSSHALNRASPVNWQWSKCSLAAPGAWWFWVDACAASHTKVPFLQYLPGLIATLALIMINSIRR